MASSSATIDFATAPSKQADLAETWLYLNAGVDHIMNTLEKGLSFAGYTNLYTTVYNYCTSTKMHGRMDGNRCESPSSIHFDS
jgi:cullin 1